MFAVAKLAMLLLTGSAKNRCVTSLRAFNNFSQAPVTVSMPRKWVEVLQAIETASSLDVHTRKSTNFVALWALVHDAFTSLDAPPESWLRGSEPCSRKRTAPNHGTEAHHERPPVASSARTKHMQRGLLHQRSNVVDGQAK
jgi:hypothetical protein